jgi:hypothetical protein
MFFNETLEYRIKSVAILANFSFGRYFFQILFMP